MKPDWPELGDTYRGGSQWGQGYDCGCQRQERNIVTGKEHGQRKDTFRQGHATASHHGSGVYAAQHELAKSGLKGVPRQEKLLCPLWWEWDSEREAIVGCLPPALFFLFPIQQPAARSK